VSVSDARPWRSPGALPAPPARPPELVPYYVWDLVVRVTHWAIVLSIFVLAATGFYIGRPFLVVPGEAGAHFVMGTARAIHSWAAIVFTLAVLSRITWMFTGGFYARWHQLLPVHRRRLSALWPTFLFYVFVRRTPPRVVGHNPLAGATYLAVFALYLTAIVTGLALYGASKPDSWLAVFAVAGRWLGGLQIARWLHHVVMWLLLGFMVHHIASGILMARVEKNATMDSIFSGYKFVRPADVEADREAARR
jgi:Ni/Fe-hydrogenase 1 B-type cytochrome subunit